MQLAVLLAENGYFLPRAQALSHFEHEIHWLRASLGDDSAHAAPHVTVKTEHRDEREGHVSEVQASDFSLQPVGFSTHVPISRLGRQHDIR